MNIKFEGKNTKGEDVTFFIKRPTSKDFRDAKLYANTNAARVIKSGDFVTRSMTREMVTKAGLWTDEDDKRLTEISQKINTNLEKLKQGGIKKSEGRQIAIETDDLRTQQMRLLSKINELDKFTIEAQTENDEFDYLFFSCFLNESGERVFSSVDEYKEKATDEPYIYPANEQLQEIVYGFGKAVDIVKNRPEYKFLVQHKFVDENLQFIDKDGNHIDRLGNLLPKDDDLVNNTNEEENKVTPEENEIGEFLDD